MTAFFGIMTAESALSAQQTALDTISHNLANATTPGYHRQNVVLQASPPYTVPTTMGPVGTRLQEGTGVTVGGISASRDLWLDGQLQSNTTANAQATTQQQGLNSLQALLGEPNGEGLSSSLQAYWSAWSNVAEQPEDLGVRGSLLRSAGDLATQFNHLAQGIQSQQNDADQQVSTMVTQINQDTQKIATLNAQIAVAHGAGQTPNDLIDQRASTVNDLAQYVQVNTVSQQNGMLNVVVGTSLLVSADRSNQLTTKSNASTGHLDVYSSDDAVTLSQPGGKLGATINLRDTVLVNTLQQLNQIASTMVTATNTLHQTGFDLNGNPGGNFFDPTGTTAATIKLDASIVNNPSAIAASKAALATGDSTIANSMANLGSTTQASLGNSSITAYYNFAIGSVGSQMAQAQSDVDRTTAAGTFLTQQQQAVSGVSVDDQATQLLVHQRAYEAAARSLTILNGLFDTLMNAVSH